ncbi:HAD family hydrolase [Lacticaseibacillus manihotivorans]|uniref:HAD family hydrolase n=1 Tax=Lacticaseibacillus manihotivorans TaxID=88233 RepID=UPI0006CF2131|nr:HAD-IIB family hydrolase [Lacticaseibacillus manihotivorans]
MTEIKLIASDLDHTLLDEAGHLPPNFYDTIRAVHDAGMHFVAASGRPLYTLKPMFAPVADVVSLVAENGAVVVRDGEMVYAQFIPKADYVRLTNYTYAKKTRRADFMRVRYGLYCQIC